MEMLHIIGVLLKWTGIILLAILGLLVLLISIVLLVPLRYEIKASFPGNQDEHPLNVHSGMQSNPKQITAQVKASWLLHLFSVKVAWQEERLDWKARIAWKVFREQDEEEAAKKRKPGKKNHSGKKKRDVFVPAEEDNVTEVKREASSATAEKAQGEPEGQTKEAKPEQEAGDQKKVTEPENEAGSQKKITKPEEKKADSKADSAGSEDADHEQPERPSLWERICSKINAFFEKIKYTFRQICDKIKVICETKEKITEFLENEVHRSAFSKVMKELVWLKRFLKPKKVHADLHFGFEDPYKTGLTLAACGMIYPIIGEHIHIRPDFENQVLEGEFYMKGRLRLIYLVIMAVGIVRDRNVRTLFANIRKIR